ncbi:type II toxin-antitoxin system RelE/ParE family toxin [Nevskia sp.]|uniref:type II toxin-antitoxin system RelE/ParE family toxin n=1 Tax=Nevskia sp. TaxID=1929292 RepID=UPI0025CE6884|nr:type II toxin-antitoxin system RelE/ParE family toxin [Nevskia sp.]
MRARYSPEAVRDLAGIASYIALDSPARARSFAAELRRACQSIARHPEAAVARFELAPALRCQPYRNYLIFLVPEAGGAVIVRVLHAARHAPIAFAGTAAPDDADPH